MGSDVEVRQSFDLTRAPDALWNEEMVKLVASTVLKRASTRSEQYFCLAVAEALDLNPFIDEIYFLPTKSKDGAGPGIKPYIGRNGLVKKAAERDAYFEADTVHANDEFRLARGPDGIELTHSYGTNDRGEVVGAYAFLHFRNGDRPAFFYAKLDEYLPTFDADWKMAASPWGNQRSAMIEKCAMIGAGRKRLNLGNVLADGEIERVVQQEALGPAPVPEVQEEFDWDALALSVGVDASVEPIPRLRAAVERIRELNPMAWPSARLEMVLTGMGRGELATTAWRIEQEVERIEPRAAESASAVEGTSDDVDPAPEAGSDAGGVEASEGVVDAVVVPDEEHVAALRRRAGVLEEQMQGARPDSDEFSALSGELDQVESELQAAENPEQGSLPL